MTIDPKTLAAPWVPVVEEQTAGALVVPETGIYAKRHATGAHSTSNTEYNAGESMIHTITAIRRIDTDEPTTWIRRQTTATRRWKVAPDVGASVVIAYRHGNGTPMELTASRIVKSFDTEPGTYAVAYAYVSDILTAPSRVVDVTAEDVKVAMVDAGVGISRISDEALADAAQTLNERRARAGTAPRSLDWLDGPAVGETIRSLKCAGYSSDIHDEIAARLRALGEAQ